MGKLELNFGGEKTMKREKRGEGNNTPPGCMSAVFQFFDFHHFNLCLHQHRPSFDQPRNSFRRNDPKGVEAPRNSLESQGIIMLTENHDASFLPLIQQVQQHSLDIPPVMSIKINKRIDGCSSSESSYSPSTKSPNLVARLMGLDLLPLDPHQSPSSSNQNPTKQNSRSNRASRSLPETPRTSSERKSDVDYYHDHHRFSLQIIREEVMEDNENRTPSSSHYYAKQIVKQVKENVGKRRVGMDITNRVLRNIAQERRDEHLLGIKVKKSSKHFTKVVEDHESALPKSTKSNKRFSDAAAVFNENTARSKKALNEPRHPSRGVARNLTQPGHPSIQDQIRSDKLIIENRNVTNERFKSRLGKSQRNVDKSYNRKDEFFVGTPLAPRTTTCSDNKCTKIPMLNDLKPQKLVANVGGSKYGSYLSNKSIVTVKKAATRICSVLLDSKDNALFKYVIKILKYFGINEDTHVPFTKLGSRSHLLDESIFNHLESSFSTTMDNNIGHQSTQLGYRNNRRLIFSLVNEILIGIINQHNKRKLGKRGVSTHYDIEIKGSELVEKICWKIKSYPAAKCEDLQDIDALVGSDLNQTTIRFLGDEEEESIVMDIEKDIIDSLVEEIVVMYA